MENSFLGKNFRQVLWLTFSFSLLGFVPHEKVRRWLNDRISLIVFRIIVRSLSAVITFHNEEYRPKNCGFCVANHTSPIDTAVLLTDCFYSMVIKSFNLPAKKCHLLCLMGTHFCALLKPHFYVPHLVLVSSRIF